jgi:hypothetical protein
MKFLSGDFYEFKNLVLDFYICTMIYPLNICPQNTPFSTKVQGYIIGKTYNCDNNEKNVLMTITYPLGFQKNWHYVN